MLPERDRRWLVDMVVDDNPSAAAIGDFEMQAEGELELDAHDTCFQRVYGSYDILVR